MACIRFTNHLQRYFPGIQNIKIEGGTVAEIIATLDQKYPGIASYILDDQGALRKHVNVFIGNELIIDRITLQDKVEEATEIHILQALSGG